MFKQLNKTRAAVSAVLLTASASAMANQAALDAISNSLDEAKPYGYAVIAVLAGLMVFRFIKKVL